MARGNQTSFFLGLSFVAYFILLLSPLAFMQTVNAEDAQDPIQESYGTGMCFTHPTVSAELKNIC